ncbi:HAD hydrolase-like protein, partial [Flavobacteriaceae bacterium]|nr:HAD hydrolase-like protein [Flavobacteriaceae bacterium]
MEKHQCALFDLDGVVVNTAQYHYLAWKNIAHLVGYDLTFQDNEQLKGVSRPDSLRVILKMAQTSISQDEFDRFLIQKNEDYLVLVQALKTTDILPGISEGLVFLKDKGIKIGLGSASKNALLILEKLNLTSYFDVIIDGNQVKKGKPHPEVFLKGSTALNV